MASNRWEYDGRSHRYRDLDTGRYLTGRDVRVLRDRATDAAVAQAGALADRVASGSLTPAGFNAEMRALIKNAYGAEYAFGRGGVNGMSNDDWGRVGAEVRRQYTYLDRFTAEMEAGTLSPAQVKARAGIYLDGATQAHGRGQAAAHGVEPPGVPGDGGTQCLGRCRCWVEWSETKTEVRMTWHVSAGESCPGCEARAAEWNPWTTEKATGRMAAVTGDVGTGGVSEADAALFEAEVVRSKELGIDVYDALPEDHRLLKNVNDSVAYLQRKGQANHRLYQVVGAEEWDGNPQSMAYFDPDDGSIRMNAGHPWWSDPEAHANALYDRGFLSTNSPHHVIIHETGHALHYQSTPDAFSRQAGWPAWRRQQGDPSTAGNVSVYGGTNEVEYVAETYTSIVTGNTENIGPDQTDLYDDLGGPEIAMELF